MYISNNLKLVIRTQMFDVEVIDFFKIIFLKVGSINYHRNKIMKSWVTFCHLSDSLRLKLPVHSVVMPA